MTPGPVRTPPLAGRKARLRASRFPYGYGVNPLSLATAVNSPARVSRRTARPRSTPLVLPGRPGFLRGASSLSGRAVLRRPVSGSFHPPSGVLFSFPSRYLVRYRSRDVFSLGGRCPPASRGKTKPRYSGTAVSAPRGLAYGAITLYGGAFQPTSATAGRACPRRPSRQPHISPRLSRGDLVWAVPLSVAPTQGIPCWFLFLPLLRCFRSGGSRPVLPGRTPVSRTPRGVAPRQEFPFGNPGFNGCLRLPRAISPLAAPFVGARAEPSTGRLRAVGPQGAGRARYVPVGLRAALIGGLK